jgi:triacylglycerol esterase/lipase EstA (alpha/beta hydrolase family)
MAVVYDVKKRLPPTWQWSAENKVNFICHSQGGTTMTYLIELLSGRVSANPDLPQFHKTNRQSWIKSVVTLGTPYKGTTVIDAVHVRRPGRASMLSPKALLTWFNRTSSPPPTLHDSNP